MTITLQFENSTDIDNFFNDFIGETHINEITAKADLHLKRVSIIMQSSDISDEKIIINEIKQYIRDSEISCLISV